MSRTRTIGLMLGAAVALVALGAALARGQLVSLLGPEREALVYDGDLKLDSGGIKVTSWGSGSYKSVYEKTYVGPEVLKVTSQGPNQGIVLHLGRAVDLTPFLAAKDSYVDLRILPAQVPKPKEEVERRVAGRQGAGLRGSRTTGGRTTGGRTTTGTRGTRGRESGGAGGPAGGQRGGRRGAQAAPGELQVAAERDLPGSLTVVLTGRMGGRGGGRGARGGGARQGGGAGGRQARQAAGGQAQRGQTTPTTPGQARTPGEIAFSLTRLRLVLFTDQGQMMADSPSVRAAARDERGWVPVTVPLARFRGAEGARSLEAIGIYADQADVFYLGQVRLITDRTEVKATVRAQPSITRVGEVIQFSVGLTGGPLDAEVSWDFDKSDPGKHLAAGRQVKFMYKQPGDYLVTCTIEDRAGVRAPMVKIIGVHVEAKPEGAEATEVTEGVR